MDVKRAYDNLEKILVQGYLAAGLSVAGQYIVFKNINDSESDTLRLIIDTENPQSNYLYHLAVCTVSVSQQFSFKNTAEGLPQLIDFYRGLPGCVVKKISDYITRLNQEYMESINFLEGYCYTSQSRYLWKTWSAVPTYGSPLVLSLKTICLNTVQQNWIAINRNLDQEEDYDRQFGLFLLVASSTNSKGAKSLGKDFDRRKREIRELREEIAYYGYDKRRTEEQKKTYKWADPSRLKSRQDIVRELYKQMRGEKDEHDLFIEKWIDQQRKKAEEAKQKVLERQQEYRKRFEDMDFEYMEESRPVSAEEMQEVLNRKAAHTREYMSATALSDMKERFIKKLGTHVIRPN